MTDSWERLAAALADRYRLLREVGAGGMATVYLAEDLKHRRQVAVKVLRQDLASSLGPDRFLREVSIAASLQHPHILPLYDSGQSDGFLYYVMPFVQGVSLRERIAEGDGAALPIREAVRILRDVADAMAYAHRHGVVHRDIKPENVMLADRHALVTDFGVAKAVSEATGVQTVTTVGVALGTPTYMAPEQAVADPLVDHRADLYAFGVMAYELLTGRPTFVGSSPQAVLAAHVTTVAEPVTQHRADIPEDLAGLVMKCLEKDRADRWQSADDLIPHLEAVMTPSRGTAPVRVVKARRRSPLTNRWTLAGAGVVVVAVAYGMFRGSGGAGQPPVGAAPAEEVPSVAVLPCSGLGDGEADRFLVDGITQEVISRLAEVEGLTVISGTSVLPLASTNLTPRQIADTLRVRYVLQCRITRAADRLRAFGELIEAQTGAVKWARTFERVGERGPAIEEAIAQNVAGALVPTSAALRAASQASRTSVQGAQQAFLEGNYALHRRGPDAIRTAVTAYRRTIALDPAFAPAYAALASAYGLSLTYGADLGVDAYEAYARGIVLADKAIALDSTIAEAYATRGYIMTKSFGPSPQIAADFTAALRYRPNSADVRGWHAHFLAREGRHDEALVSAERAVSLDPIAPGRRVGYALDAIGANRGDLAMVQTGHALSLEPGLASARTLRAEAALLLRDPAGCIDAQPSGALLAVCIDAQGDHARAQRMIDSLIAAYRQQAAGDPHGVLRSTTAGNLAVYFAWLGDADQTIDWLGQAYNGSPGPLDFRLLNSTLFDRVATNPRFQTALNRIQGDVWKRVAAIVSRLTLAQALGGT